MRAQGRLRIPSAVRPVRVSQQHGSCTRRLHPGMGLGESPDPDARSSHSPSTAMSKIIRQAREDLPSYLVMGSLVLCAFLI